MIELPLKVTCTLASILAGLAVMVYFLAAPPLVEAACDQSTQCEYNSNCFSDGACSPNGCSQPYAQLCVCGPICFWAPCANCSQ